MQVDREIVVAGEGSRSDVKPGKWAAGSFLPDLFLVAPFIAVFLVQLTHHEMWRDELNAFGIALASPTLPSLFWHIHYEGHPWLWYALLWIVSRFTPSPVGMKVLQAVVGTAIYLVIALGSPFSRVEKVLLFLCYFVSFEYTVLSRMYGVVLLLLLIYVRQRTLHPERVLCGALLLGLMASTDMMGLLLSGALFIERGFSGLTERGAASTLEKRQLACGGVYFVLTALSLWSLAPSPNISWRTTGHPFEFASDPKHLLTTALRYVVLPYFPTLGLRSFFNAFPTHNGDHLAYLAIFFPLVLGSYYFLFRQRRNLLLMIGLTIAFSTAFGHLIYEGYVRHYGVTFLAFVAAVWLLRSQRSRLPAIAYVLLGFTAAGGIYAGIQAWQRPFSNTGPAARWMVANHLDTLPIVGSPDGLVASIAELLGRSVYMLDCNCSDKFLLLSNRRDSFDRSQIPDRLVIAMESLRVSSFVYASALPLSTEEKSAIRNKEMAVKPIASFTGAETNENVYLYQVSYIDAPIAHRVSRPYCPVTEVWETSSHAAIARPGRATLF